MWPLLFPIFIGIIILIAVIASHHFEQQRTEKLKGVANELGLAFADKVEGNYLDNLPPLRLFNLGHGRKVVNLIHGDTEEVAITIFGYRYRTGGGNNSQHHMQTVILFHSKQLQLPQFELRPEGFFHKIGQALGGKDINFASHPDFSNAFLLNGEDEDAIRALFSSERLDFLEQKHGICIEGSGNHLICYRSSKRVSPDQVRSFMEEGFEIFQQFTNADAR